MHTTEQAQQLWCPMARVAQVGVLETTASYNRVMVKTHRIVKLQSAMPADQFELGGEPTIESDATILDSKMALSAAARCLGDKCAAWRWHPDAHHCVNEGQMVMDEAPAPGYCGLAGAPATQP